MPMEAAKLTSVSMLAPGCVHTASVATLVYIVYIVVERKRIPCTIGGILSFFGWGKQTAWPRSLNPACNCRSQAHQERSLPAIKRCSSPHCVLRVAQVFDCQTRHPNVLGSIHNDSIPCKKVNDSCMYSLCNHFLSKLVCCESKGLHTMLHLSKQPLKMT